MKPSNPAPCIRLTIQSLTAALLLVSPLTAGEWSSYRLDSPEEIFRAADLDRNNNLNGEERDRLRLAFAGRPDLRILDVNRNGKLEREEIDLLEQDRVKKKKKKKNGKKQ